MMDTQQVLYDRDEAARLLRKYREHRAYSTPVDREIVRLAELVNKGKIIIQALASIRKAGLGPDGLPKLAIARADEEKCFLSLERDGRAVMSGERFPSARTSKTRVFKFEAGTFPVKASASGLSALVPHIPPDIRPRRGLQNYHILFEAVWRNEPPVDPMLLRRLGTSGDMWLVVGSWDLTPIERAVLAERMTR